MAVGREKSQIKPARKLVRINDYTHCFDEFTDFGKLTFHYFLLLNDLLNTSSHSFAVARIQHVFGALFPNDTLIAEGQAKTGSLPSMSDTPELPRNSTEETIRVERLKIQVFIYLLSKHPNPSFRISSVDDSWSLDKITYGAQEIEDELTDQERKFFDIAGVICRAFDSPELTPELANFQLCFLARAELFLVHYHGDFYDPLKTLLAPMLRTRHPYIRDIKFIEGKRERKVGRKTPIEAYGRLYEKYQDSVVFLNNLWDTVKTQEQHLVASDYATHIYSLTSVLFARLHSDEFIKVYLYAPDNQIIVRKFLLDLTNLAEKLLHTLNDSPKFKRSMLSYSDFMVHAKLLELIFDCKLWYKKFDSGDQERARVKVKSSKSNGDKVNHQLFQLYRQNAQTYAQSCPRIAEVYLKKAIRIAKPVPALKKEMAQLYFELANLYHADDRLSNAIKAMQLHIKYADGAPNPTANRLLSAWQQLLLERQALLGIDLYSTHEVIKYLTCKYQRNLLASNLSRRTMPIVTQTLLSRLAVDLLSGFDKPFEKFVREKIDAANGDIPSPKRDNLYFLNCKTIDDFYNNLIAAGLKRLPAGTFLGRDLSSSFTVIEHPENELPQALRNIGLLDEINIDETVEKKDTKEPSGGRAKKGKPKESSKLLLDIARVKSLDIDAELNKLPLGWVPHLPVIRQFLQIAMQGQENPTITPKYVIETLRRHRFGFYESPTAKEYKAKLKAELKLKKVLVYLYSRPDGLDASKFNTLGNWSGYKENIIQIIMDEKINLANVSELINDLERSILSTLASDLHAELIKVTPQSDISKWVDGFIQRFPKYLPYKRNIKNLLIDAQGVPEFANNPLGYLQENIAALDLTLIETLVKNGILSRLLQVNRTVVTKRLDHSGDESKPDAELKPIKDALLDHLDDEFTADGNLDLIALVLNELTGDFREESLDGLLDKKQFVIYNHFSTKNILKRLQALNIVKLKRVSGDVVYTLTANYRPDCDASTRSLDASLTVSSPTASVSFGPLARRLIAAALDAAAQRSKRVTLDDFPEVLELMLLMQGFNRDTSPLAKTWWLLNEIANYIKHSGPLKFVGSPFGALTRGSFNCEFNFVTLRQQFEATDLMPYLQAANNQFPNPLSKKQLKALAARLSVLIKRNYLKEVIVDDITFTRYYEVSNPLLQSICTQGEERDIILVNQFYRELGNHLQSIIPTQINTDECISTLCSHIGSLLFARKSQNLGHVDLPDAYVCLERLLSDARSLSSTVLNVFFLKGNVSPLSLAKPTLSSGTSPKQPARQGLTATKFRFAHTTILDNIDAVMLEGDVATLKTRCETSGNQTKVYYPPLASVYYKFSETELHCSASKIDIPLFGLLRTCLLTEHQVNYAMQRIKDGLAEFDIYGEEYIADLPKYSTNSYLCKQVGDKHPALKMTFEYAWSCIFKLFRETLLFIPSDQNQDGLAILNRKCYMVAHMLRELLDNTYTAYLRKSSIKITYTSQAKFPLAKQKSEFANFLLRDNINLDILATKRPRDCSLLTAAQIYSNNKEWMFGKKNCLEMLIMLTNKDKHTTQTLPSVMELQQWQQQHDAELHSQFFMTFNEDGQTYRIPAAPFLYKTLLCVSRLMNGLLGATHDAETKYYSWAIPTDETCYPELVALPKAPSIQPERAVVRRSAQSSSDSSPPSPLLLRMTRSIFAEPGKSGLALPAPALPKPIITRPATPTSKESPSSPQLFSQQRSSPPSPSKQPLPRTPTLAESIKQPIAAPVWTLWDTSRNAQTPDTKSSSETCKTDDLKR